MAKSWQQATLTSGTRLFEPLTARQVHKKELANLHSLHGEGLCIRPVRICQPLPFDDREHDDGMAAA